jgi:hypothetical protein
MLKNTAPIPSKTRSTRDSPNSFEEMRLLLDKSAQTDEKELVENNTRLTKALGRYLCTKYFKDNKFTKEHWLMCLKCGRFWRLRKKGQNDKCHGTGTNLASLSMEFSIYTEKSLLHFLGMMATSICSPISTILVPKWGSPTTVYETTVTRTGSESIQPMISLVDPDTSPSLADTL